MTPSPKIPQDLKEETVSRIMMKLPYFYGRDMVEGDIRQMMRDCFLAGQSSSQERILKLVDGFLYADYGCERICPACFEELKSLIQDNSPKEKFYPSEITESGFELGSAPADNEPVSECGIKSDDTGVGSAICSNCGHDAKYHFDEERSCYHFKFGVGSCSCKKFTPSPSNVNKEGEE